MLEHDVRIEWRGWVFTVYGSRLVLSVRGEDEAELDLAPIVEGRPTRILGWSADAGGYRGILSESGSVLLGIRDGHVAYGMETDVPQFNRLAFFCGASFRGDHWQSFLSDGYDRRWDKRLDVEVPISSSYDDLLHPDVSDSAGLTDPGDKPPVFIWNMPVRDWAFETGAGWVGFTIPGALPVGVTRLAMARQRFSLAFEVLRPSCREGKMPVVYIVPGLADPYDVLDEDRLVSDRLGLTVRKSGDHPAFWGLPGFKAYLEQYRLSREAEKEGRKASDYPDLITREKLVGWIRTVKKDLGLAEMFAILEQGAFRYYGDYRPTDALGGVRGFRQMVDGLRSENVHMCFYVHPFMCNTKVDFYREHPEAFCRPKEKGHETFYALEHGDETPRFALIDWTHPLGREYLLGQVELVLSHTEGCLDCDWLRSNHWRSPDPRVYDFHDPDWGIGDLMSMKVQKLLYERAKEIKPHACVSKAGLGAPYMQPYADVDLLCEEWNGSTDSWYRRGRIITRLLRDMIYITDPYFLTISKSYEYYMAMGAWCILEDPIVRHAIHPYMYFRELREKDYRRRRAGVEAQRIAPLLITDEPHVEPAGDGVRISRRRAAGPLAGWYAALTFGKRCVAHYAETEVRVATTETREIDLPLPPGATLGSVAVVAHDGAVAPGTEWKPVDTADGPGIRMRVEDCGQKAMYYRVSYRLKETL
jgi:hypothetical protein